ncbi:putative bifunctional diguanylate cyclase/phosphodiesterase [Novosphingobium sp. KACC 22771]|uniref:putative bifunctional diguanylate cyclase/phosphodiesterase n=1 Tax=Novosphingobium sp. KACC 22771 TaxID=3025670 RepID=UPI002365D5C4|nr:EAL domain-containing protein [Novosphingobium sp. KACC 22771]WDF74734.1 EAL domain-containing protein [Novosphingobium sp. KACC 22771]
MIDLRLTTLEHIARGDSLGRVMDHLCRAFEANFPEVICAVLMVDRGGILHPLASPSLPESYSAALDNLAIGPNVGSCGTAAYIRAPVEVRDIATDPRWANFRDAALSLGLRACWSSPILDPSGLVLATFALYFRHSRGPTQGERQLVDICIHLCELAMARHLRVTERERSANMDALTGLPNRGSFEQTLEHLDCETPGSWALMLVDLDNLKTTNDTFGHEAGDRLLQETAGRLGKLATPDWAFRIGGDEFAILIVAPERLEALDAYARHILTHLSPSLDFATFSIQPEATIGYAAFGAQDRNADDTRRHADHALYHAKSVHRGSFRGYSQDMNDPVAARLSSISAVQAAMAEGRLRAWYQPILRLNDRRIVGLEALCRMVTPQGTVLPASAFAEATLAPGIASQLTRVMLEMVAADLRLWRDSGIPPISMAVNVTATDLRGGRLLPAITQAFQEDRDLISQLVLEVNESVYFDRHDRNMAVAIDALREQGIRIALDDFGTGFASLTHLLDFPFDSLKIDKSFIDRLTVDDLSSTIIAALLAIADKRGATVTAEGIEHAGQAARLSEMGCPFGQGYLFSPAVDRTQTAGLLIRHAASGPISAPMPLADTNGLPALGAQDSVIAPDVPLVDGARTAF